MQTVTTSREERGINRAYFTLTITWIMRAVRFKRDRHFKCLKGARLCRHNELNFFVYPKQGVEFMMTFKANYAFFYGTLRAINFLSFLSSPRWPYIPAHWSGTLPPLYVLIDRRVGRAVSCFAMYRLIFLLTYGKSSIIKGACNGYFKDRFFTIALNGNATIDNYSRLASSVKAVIHKIHTLQRFLWCIGNSSPQNVQRKCVSRVLQIFHVLYSNVPNLKT